MAQDKYYPFSDLLERDRAMSTGMAERPAVFINQQLQTLEYRHARSPNGTLSPSRILLDSERDFWQTANRTDRNARSAHLFDDYVLDRFTISDWFPRAPGVFWTEKAEMSRSYVWGLEQEHDAQLGGFYKPQEKMSLIENGGLGTIRLRPRKIDGEYYWFATAVTGRHCCSGIPLAIPETLLRQSGFFWGDTANLKGRLRFLQDAGLNDIARELHHVRPLIFFVEEFEGALPRRAHRSPVLSPVVLLKSEKRSTRNEYGDRDRGSSYTFAQCKSGNDREIDSVCDWMQTYALKFSSKIITNFDEQRPHLADAPLSYQRLVTETYDREIVHQYGGTVMVERLETLIHYDSSTNYHGDFYMGDTINASGNATVFSRSSLTNATVTINSAPSLTSPQKEELNRLVQALDAQLAAIKPTYPAEVQRIEKSAQEALEEASKPVAERKKPFLDISAEGLLRTAKLLADVAPTAVHAAEKLATFVQGLV